MIRSVLFFISVTICNLLFFFLTYRKCENYSSIVSFKETSDFSEKSKLFRATDDTLLSLHSIPDLIDPKERLKKIKPFEYQVTKKERLLFYKLLHIFDRIMKENGIGYFIHSGTLIGSYRNHDFIPWDDDIDVFVDFENRKQMEKVITMSNISNLALYPGAEHYKLYLKKESVASNEYWWKWPYIDISFYILNKTHIQDLAKTYGRFETYPKSIIFPLITRPFFVFNLPSPRDTFAYLTWSIGYTDECVMNSYSHIIEGGSGIRGTAKCSSVTQKYPWVKRMLVGNKIVEELIYENTVVQRLEVNEPVYAVSKVYSVELQDGFKYPDDVELLPRKS